MITLLFLQISQKLYLCPGRVTLLLITTLFAAMPRPSSFLIPFHAKFINMGANSPQPPTLSPEPKKKSLLPFILGGATMLIVCALQWIDIVEYIDGEPRLTDKHRQRLEKKLTELEEGEQYALIATKEGFYPCVHSGRALYYLHIGEVWKYGVTTKGERGRFTGQFILDHSVKYVIQSTGSIDKCLKEEQVKLFYYPLLPENLARSEKDRLIRPPFNPIFN